MPRKQLNSTASKLLPLVVMVAIGVPLVSMCVGQQHEPGNAAPKTRDFQFTYAVRITGLEPGATARIWLPVPPSNEDQQAKVTRQEFPGGIEPMIGSETKYGNKILYVAPKADSNGTIPLSVTYRVKRFEVKGDTRSDKVARAEIEKFLKPDAKVPIGGKPLTLLEGKALPEKQMELGRLLYDVVNDHMTYSKQGTGWGQGDALWACDSRYGNCSDFHSLFIALARSNRMPAKFEIGFPLPPQRGRGEITGYHCWAKFKPEGFGWVPVDISEANKVKEKEPAMVEYYFGNLTEDRVTFTVGRDLALVPAQDGPPLNFFVYPYVEVSGKPYAADKIERKFTFEDVSAGGR
jgi:transglutaminase-like putative cysteine protease